MTDLSIDIKERQMLRTCVEALLRKVSEIDAQPNQVLTINTLKEQGWTPEEEQVFSELYQRNDLLRTLEKTLHSLSPRFLDIQKTLCEKFQSCGLMFTFKVALESSV